MPGKASAKAKADEKADAASSLPALDADGSLDAEVAMALSPAELKAVCKAAGKEFGGITIAADGRAYL